MSVAVIDDTAGVYWRHENIVTGRYAETDINGQYGGYTEDSPTAIEYDPLGGSIKVDAPLDETVNPSNLMQFQFAGDSSRPENGCMWNGDPMPCTAISGVIRGSANTTINVDVRAEGGYSLYRNLSGLVSTWHYNIRERLNNEDSRLTPRHYQDSANWHGDEYHLFVGSFFAQYLSDISETVISNSSKTPVPDESNNAENAGQSNPTTKNARDNLVFTETGRKAVLDGDKFRKCVGDLFGVTPERISKIVNDEPYETNTGIFMDANRSGFGSFSGNASGRNINVDISGQYTRAGLKTTFYGNIPRMANTTVGGSTPKNFTGTIYVASDIQNHFYFMSVVVHEIGNALGLKTGKTPTAQ